MRKPKIVVAAAVILYNPTDDDFARLTPRIADNMEVVVADNSEPQLIRPKGFHWCGMGENKGVGAALNAVIDYARDELDADWVLTLDQDSRLDENRLHDYIQEALAIPGLEQIAVIAPNLGDEPPLEESQDVDMVITSGSLFNTRVCRDLGGFAEELFVDEVDHEYCLRARSKAYRVVKLGGVVLPHVPGELRKVAGGKTVDWHSPRRLYYIARNYWYLRRRYSSRFPHVIKERKRLVIAKYKAYLRYHPNKFASVAALVKGTLHGMMGRYGR